MPDGDISLSPAEHDLEAQWETGPLPTEGAPEPAQRPAWTVHTRATVRRMVAVDATAIASAQRRDPRREDD